MTQTQNPTIMVDQKDPHFVRIRRLRKELCFLSLQLIALALYLAICAGFLTQEVL